MLGERVGRSTGSRRLFEMSKAFLEMVQTVQQMEASEKASAAKVQLAEIEAAQRGDTAKLLRISCTWLHLKSSRLDPADFPERADDVRQLVERSQAKIAELQKEGQACGTSVPGPPHDMTAASAYSQ